MALSGGRHARSLRKAYFVEFYGREAGFWLLVFYEISRTPFLSYSHFQGLKLKLRSRAFCWCIVCFCTSNGSFIILKKAEDFFFEIRLFPQFLKMTKIKNIFSPAFFNILKEPYVVKKQTIHQQKALDLSFNLTPWKWAWHHQEGATPPRREKHRCARRVFDSLPSRALSRPHDNATPTFRVPN